MSDSDVDDQASLLPQPQPLKRRWPLRPLAVVGSIVLVAAVTSKTGARWHAATRGVAGVDEDEDEDKATATATAIVRLFRNSTSSGMDMGASNTSASEAAAASNDRGRHNATVNKTTIASKPLNSTGNVSHNHNHNHNHNTSALGSSNSPSSPSSPSSPGNPGSPPSSSRKHTPANLARNASKVNAVNASSSIANSSLANTTGNASSSFKPKSANSSQNTSQSESKAKVKLNLNLSRSQNASQSLVTGLLTNLTNASRADRGNSSSSNSSNSSLSSSLTTRLKLKLANASVLAINSSQVAQVANLGKVLTDSPKTRVYNQDMRDRTLAQMQRASEDDRVEVLFLLSPLLKEHAGDILGQAGLYHTGLGFRNVGTGLESTAQFFAEHFDASIVLPAMDKEKHHMEWRNSGHLGFREGKMDLEYWTVIQTLGSISGADYNHFLEWAHIPQSTLKKYVLFSLAPENGHKPGHLPYTSVALNMPPGSATCFDVTQHLLCGLRNLTGGKFNNVHMPLRDDSYLWASPGTLVRKLDMTSGSADYELAWNFYAALNESAQAIGMHANYDIEQMRKDFAAARLRHQLTYAVYTDFRGDSWWYLPAASIADVVTEKLPVGEVMPGLPSVPVPP